MDDSEHTSQARRRPTLRLYLAAWTPVEKSTVFLRRLRAAFVRFFAKYSSVLPIPHTQRQTDRQRERESNLRSSFCFCCLSCDVRLSVSDFSVLSLGGVRGCLRRKPSSSINQSINQKKKKP